MTTWEVVGKVFVVFLIICLLGVGLSMGYRPVMKRDLDRLESKINMLGVIQNEPGFF